MNAKTLMIALAAFAVGGVAHAITSDEIAAALDTDIANIVSSGDADWVVDSDVHHKGGASMRSGAITPASNWAYSTLSFVVDVKVASTLDFWVKTSSVANSHYGALVVTVDNETRYYEGIVDWQKASLVLLPGNHLIKMSFQRYKAYYSSDWNAGSNCAWLDQFEINPILVDSPKVKVTKISCKQRTPWNGKIDVDYSIEAENDVDVWVFPVAYDKDTDTTMTMKSLEGDGVGAAVRAGDHRMTWTVTDDYPAFHSTALTVKMTAMIGAKPYMVVDLSGGVDAHSYPVQYFDSIPNGAWSDEYKKTKMAFKLIPAGSFMMGSPTDEGGRGSYEDQHGVVLTKPFYLGVFECTQKQYELIMGANPVTSSSYKGDMRPVAKMSYDNIRGSVNGAGWPTHNQVDADSFMGRLRSKVNMFFDLPTEAQWEYACRAGTGGVFNNGRNYTVDALKEVARCSYNSGNDSSYPSDKKGGYSYATTVGCYLANAWGLYDMHGNVYELCRDFWNQGLGFTGVIDPKGAKSSYRYYSSDTDMRRVYRGGSWNQNQACRSAYRSGYMTYGSTTSDYVGFRVMCSPVAE